MQSSILLGVHVEEASQTKSLFETVQNSTLTPVMQQYASIKAEYSDCLLMFRLGDFYELFFDDATLAASVLDIVLTQRAGTPMCGVPYHSALSYFAKLLKAGHKVAVCEQMETPVEAKKRGHKAVVRREVVRILTPATVLEEQMIDGARNQYLVAIHANKDGHVCFACADVALGRTWLQSCTVEDMASELARLNPCEIILSEAMYSGGIKDAVQPYKNKLTLRANARFNLIRAQETVLRFYEVVSLQVFTPMEELEVCAFGGLIDYICYTYKQCKPRLEKPNKLNAANYLEMDASTRRNLELTESLSGNTRRSILSIIDNTNTPMGRRLFYHHISFPLTNPAAINKRLDSVQFFVSHTTCLEQIRGLLMRMPDLQRLLAKVHAQQVTFVDLIHIRGALKTSIEIVNILIQAGSALPANLRIMSGQVGGFDALADCLEQALIGTAELGAQRYVRYGFSPKLDNLYNVRDNADDLITQLRDKYRAEYGIPSLKITFNNMLGYYIEVSATHLSKVNTEQFMLRQSMVNASRFTTVELQELERQILECGQKIVAEEEYIFQELCKRALKHSDHVANCAHAIAAIDVASANAELALKYNYTRPEVDDSMTFIIQDGRHPLVERYSTGAFIPNSCGMNEDDNLWLITGPNMAGKSTYLRQNAIIIIMTQMGMFVPAKAAHIGVVDKLFSRIGAADDISSGQSTFMVEMIETANILNNSTSRSFLVLDEVGRGTSTKDGLAIAWAILEKIHNDISARTLFATHYHELTNLEGTLPRLSCYTMHVKEWGDKIVFIHEVIKGKANKSYGIHVAELAGVPADVIARANGLISKMECVELDAFNTIATSL